MRPSTAVTKTDLKERDVLSYSRKTCFNYIYIGRREDRTGDKRCATPNRISLISPVPLIISEEEGLEGYKWLGRQEGREGGWQSSPDFPSSLAPAAITPAFPRNAVVTARDHPPEQGMPTTTCKVTLGCTCVWCAQRGGLHLCKSNGSTNTILVVPHLAKSRNCPVTD